MAGTLADLPAELAERFGDATALSIKPGFRWQHWSYRSLDDASRRLAALLQHDYGVERGDRVVLWAPNRPEWVAAFFAGLRAGAVVVPLDLRSAPDYIDRVFRQTEPRLLIGSRLTLGDEPASPVLLIEEITGRLAGEQERAPAAPVVAPEDLAEIMFTSGTTGDPKGVMLTHRNILSNVEAIKRVVPVKRSYCLLSILPLSHMFEQNAGLLSPLTGGARIVYPVSRQPRLLVKTMQEAGVTTMMVVPQVLQLLLAGIQREAERRGRRAVFDRMLHWATRLPMGLRRLLFASVHRQFGGRLRWISSGGAYLDPALARTWQALGVEVLQGYGATEASPIISATSFEDNRLGSVGRPVPGVEVGIAQDGEVQARGPNITPGYWRNEAATLAAFDDGWYRTGDLGELDAQGHLFLKGRKKDLIVLANGQNVYPEDIETGLARQPGVRDAVVVGLPRDGGAVEVHAVLLMESPSEETAAGRVRDTNARLGAHQQIQGFTVWPEEDFPRTHTLKVRKSLVLERLGAGGRPAAVSAPASTASATSPLQRLVADLARVPAEGVTPEKSLGLDLGLDSLGRVELLSAIEQEMGVYLDETSVGPDTTVAQLERLLQSGVAAPALPLPAWPRSWWCRVLRAVLQVTLVFPALRLLYRVEAQGQEHLRGLRQPVLFAANHNMKLDNGVILWATPFAWRWRLAIAAAADDVLGHWFPAAYSQVLGNAFPFAREGAVRTSLEHLGWLMDQGWNILIYPEGRLTPFGEIRPFLGGTGLIAVESWASIVPIRLRPLARGWFDGRFGLVRGRAHVTFGPPLTFTPGTPYGEATRRLEAAVRAL
ncbi:MAG: AMP-binding protein [Chloroflexi bacterium]|nr:AMP-binding protein [Chloroflexota bacterium]